nr:hypothetical protein [Ruminiclostridium josui]
MAKVTKMRKVGALVVGSALLFTTMIPASISSVAASEAINVSIDTNAERAAISLIFMEVTGNSIMQS